MEYAEKSVGLKDGSSVGRETVKWFAKEIMKLDEQLAWIENTLHKKCMEIPYAENILEIKGVGENILAGIVAEMGDISRFDDVKEIQKLSGMSLVACSSGKHKGQTGDANGSGTGCSRRQNQQFPMPKNLKNCMYITQHGLTTR